MENKYHLRKKTLWEKDKLLVPSNFSFSHNVFHSYISLVHQNAVLCGTGLILSQTTDFRLFRSEEVCRWQFQIWWKWRNILHKGGKHCWKRRNCASRAISAFPTVFLKDLYCRHLKTGLVWESLIQCITICSAVRRKGKCCLLDFNHLPVLHNPGH